MSAEERMATIIEALPALDASASDQRDRAWAFEIAKAVTADGFTHPDDTEWCVYEDAIGKVWAVEPTTRAKAEREAFLVGEGHRAVLLSVGQQLSAAYWAGAARA
jgi:hypothetical protein